MKYSIIIPTHIRELELKRCIERLLNLLSDNLNLIIVLDGSPKNIVDMVNSYDSKYIHPLLGDGSLFWGGAIHIGMEYAFFKLSSDRVIWLNDDTTFNAESVQKFLSYDYNDFSVVGARLHGVNVDRNIYDIAENQGLVEVNYLNGNFTSISKIAFEWFGNINIKKFPHFADAPYLESISKSKEFELIVNSDVSVDIHYDVLRHLSCYHQFILRKDRFNFVRWSLFDIRSKWYLPYRKNYYLNKFGSVGYFALIVGFLRDWLPVLLISPLNMIANSAINDRVLSNLKLSLSKSEFCSLLEELK